MLFLLGSIKGVYKNIKTYSMFNLCGGTLFTIGSFLFLYTITTRAGIWVFRCGSICYICGGIFNLHHLLKGDYNLHENRFKIASITQYMCGSCLFITGGILSELRVTHVAFATIWTIGSVLFTSGAIFSFL